MPTDRLRAMQQDVFIHNARIWLGSAGWASSLWIHAGRIAAIDPHSPRPPKAQALDAKGRVIAPGFVDAHLHLIMGGLTLSDLDLRDVHSPDEFRQHIAEAHERLEPGRWLVARNWSAETWGGEPAPDKSWLAAAGDRPVVCYRMDLHAAVVNEAVLRKCDLAVNPPGGRVVRDQRGQPTGLLLEAALWKFINPLIPEPTPEIKQAALLRAQAHCHQHGITGVGTMEYSREVREVLLPLADQLTLRCAVTLLDRGWPVDIASARELADACYGSVSIVGCKAFADGTLGSRTARLLADYADDPGNRGLLVEIAADGHLRDWAHAVAGAGFSPSIHAIGDAAVRLALDSCSGLPDVQARIEHAQQIDEADIERFAPNSVIASMQPLHKADDGRYALARLGHSRLTGFFPFRQLLDAQAPLAFGSDWPVVWCDPIAGMRAAITGLTLDGKAIRTEENLTVEEALSAYTVDAARALNIIGAGTIQEGSAADLVVFDIDPFRSDWVNRPPQIMITIAGGRIVHECPQHAHPPVSS